MKFCTISIDSVVLLALFSLIPSFTFTEKYLFNKKTKHKVNMGKTVTEYRRCFHFEISISFVVSFFIENSTVIEPDIIL